MKDPFKDDRKRGILKGDTPLSGMIQEELRPSWPQRSMPPLARERVREVQEGAGQLSIAS